MKSIKEATDETTSIHVERGNDNDCLFVSRSYLKNTLDCLFKAGVEFAQRWIPIEEESPAEKSKLPFICKDATTDEYFLCWWKNSKFKSIIATPQKTGGDCDGNLFREDLTEVITHWRPIER